jgi:hypothetical protein
MPYITQERRKEFDVELAKIGPRIKNKGELNYCVSILMLWYKSMHGENYQSLSDAKNALTDATEEWVENHIKPYERKKRDENGDLELYIDSE